MHVSHGGTFKTILCLSPYEINVTSNTQLTQPNILLAECCGSYVIEADSDTQAALQYSSYISGEYVPNPGETTTDLLGDNYQVRKHSTTSTCLVQALITIDCTHAVAVMSNEKMRF